MRKIEIVLLFSVIAAMFLALYVSTRFIDNRVSDVQDVAPPPLFGSDYG